MAMRGDIVLDPGDLSPEDLAALKTHRRHLAALARSEGEPASGLGMTVHVRTGDGDEEVTLPPRLARAVAATLTEVADGHAVHVVPATEELTTSEAADLLNVSRPFFVKLLEQGALPFRMVGTHRRVRRADVTAYKRQMYQAAEAALQELADQAQDFGLGYE
jgi:excisionase family DNA binding protein